MKTLTLTEHLLELRKRLFICLLTLLVIFLSLVYFANDIYTLVSEPIRQVLPEGATMIATDVTTTFFAPFKLTFCVSAALAAPVILHQLWLFVAPGLYQSEKKIALTLLVLSIVLFYLGIGFAFFVVFPIMMRFFAQVSPEHVMLAPDIQQYLSVALKLFFAFGFAFQIPVAILLVIRAGILSAQQLSRLRPYVIVMCFILGMLLTPPDIISQTLLAIPMWLLFEGGIQMSKLLKLYPTPE